MIQIQVDASKALAGLRATATRQVPFAMALTLNRLANDGQKAEQARIQKSFKLRRETFNLRGVYISKADRATKARLVVTIQIEAKRSYLDKFEKGGDKVPVGGRRMLAVPNKQIFGNKILKPNDPLRPKNLHLHKDSHGRVIGDQRTFVIKVPSGQRFIMQRVNRKLVFSGKSGITKGLRQMDLDNFAGGQGPRLKGEKLSIRRTAGLRRLYSLVQRVKVGARLEFVDTITGAVNANATMRFNEAFMQAMRGAR